MLTAIPGIGAHQLLCQQINTQQRSLRATPTFEYWQTAALQQVRHAQMWALQIMLRILAWYRSFINV